MGHSHIDDMSGCFHALVHLTLNTLLPLVAGCDWLNKTAEVFAQYDRQVLGQVKNVHCGELSHVLTLQKLLGFSFIAY